MPAAESPAKIKVVHKTTFEPSMTTISAAEANRHFSPVLRQVARGETPIITSRGRPMATIAPQAERILAKRQLLARLTSQLPAGAGALGHALDCTRINAVRPAVLEWSDAFEVADSTAPVSWRRWIWPWIINCDSGTAPSSRLPRAAQRGHATRLYSGRGNGGQSPLAVTSSLIGATPGQ